MRKPRFLAQLPIAHIPGLFVARVPKPRSSYSRIAHCQGTQAQRPWYRRCTEARIPSAAANSSGILVSAQLLFGVHAQVLRVWDFQSSGPQLTFLTETPTGAARRTLRCQLDPSHNALRDQICRKRPLLRRAPFRKADKGQLIARTHI